MKTEELLSPPKRVKKNRLLHGPGKAIDLDQFLLLRKIAGLSKEIAGRELNLSRVPENLIRRIHAVYGDEGLFQLTILAMAHEPSEFLHFIEPLNWILAVDELAKTHSEVVVKNDPSLRPSPKLSRFNTNVLQPSFSRKLYRAGRHHGSLVYGVGGPRILVSHPFQGRTDDIYDLYANSDDVVTSLCLRGYRGTFHFLDYLPGLNHEVEGVPAWALWFSIIAGQSDLVIYVKEYEGDFLWAQQLEIEMTPNHVQKIVVEIPHKELKWATKTDLPSGSSSIYIGDGRVMNEEEWMQMEREHSDPFIKNYLRRDIPHDRFFVLDEEGRTTEHAINDPLY